MAAGRWAGEDWSMSDIAGPAPSSVGGSRWGPGRVIGVSVGSIIALIGAVIALAGLALVVVHLGFRDGDGYINTSTRHISTATYAFTTGGVQLGDLHGDGGDWAVENLDGRVRIRAELRDSSPVFVGIARTADLNRYMSGVAHARIRDFNNDTPLFRTVAGSRAPRPPGSQSFWEA